MGSESARSGQRWQIGGRRSFPNCSRAFPNPSWSGGPDQMTSQKIGERGVRALVKENAHLAGKCRLVQAAGGKVQHRDDLVARQAVIQLDQLVDGDASSRFSKTTDTGIRVPGKPRRRSPFQAHFLPPDIGTNRALPCGRSLLQGRRNESTKVDLMPPGRKILPLCCAF